MLSPPGTLEKRQPSPDVFSGAPERERRVAAYERSQQRLTAEEGDLRRQHTEVTEQKEYFEKNLADLRADAADLDRHEQHAAQARGARCHSCGARFVGAKQVAHHGGGRKN